MVETVVRWVAIADEQLQNTSTTVHGQPGIVDETDVDTALNAEQVVGVDRSVVRVGGYQLLTSAQSNPFPWDTPHEKGRRSRSDSARRSRLRWTIDEVGAVA